MKCMIVVVVLSSPAFAAECRPGMTLIDPARGICEDLDSFNKAILGTSQPLAATPARGLAEVDLQGIETAMLHGYAPKEGDVVEWYVYRADCANPSVECKFELSIRKKESER